MIANKYLIMIGIIICLLVLYYFYDEISNVKKLFMPTYQKTMALEAKIMDLERRNIEFNKRKMESINCMNDSPALSITYQSDMMRNNNLSVKYGDLSETEAKELLQKIENNNIRERELLKAKRNSTHDNFFNKQSNLNANSNPNPNPNPNPNQNPNQNLNQNLNPNPNPNSNMIINRNHKQNSPLLDNN